MRDDTEINISVTVLRTVSAAITAATGAVFHATAQRRAVGGCISQAFILEDDARRYFVKLNDAKRLPMFEAEAAGLRELASAGALRVPRPVCVGVADTQGFIAIEHIDLNGRGDMAAFGRQLARLHQTQAPRFGWRMTNALGATRQLNGYADDWCEFWRDCRLGYQLSLAAQAGYGGALQDKGARVLTCFHELFTDYRPRPSLLHGDLWAGNFGFNELGQAVIFDPAVYFGDRETDLAMTELFGGYSDNFYAAYREALPLAPGYPVRRTLYNLYHVLNHLNLFGGGYARQAEHMMDALLSELGASART